jgi:hypothetical protein
VESKNSNPEQKEVLQRPRRPSSPAAAVAGAFASFAEAALGRQRQKPENPAGNSSLVQINLSEPKSEPPIRLDLQYSQISSLRLFQRSLAGITIGPGDTIYALGDGEVRIFDPALSLIRSWKAPDQAKCIAAGPDESVYLGMNSRVEVFDRSGNKEKSFETGSSIDPQALHPLRSCPGKFWSPMPLLDISADMILAESRLAKSEPRAKRAALCCRIALWISMSIRTAWFSQRTQAGTG